jgi:queuosine precursor transporter
MIWVICYIATIIGANWAIETYGIVPVGFGLMAPAGVYFAGLAFTCRDLVHDRLGVAGAVAAIAIGAFLSYWISPAFAVASGVAFLFSEICDLAVYAPLRRQHWLGAVAASNIVGLVVDSALFLWLAFGSLQFIEGQIVGKAFMTAVAVAVLWGVRVVVPQWRGAAGTVRAD